MINKKYKHKNGNIYTVLHLTNTFATPENSDKYPIMVVYKGENGRVWSRLLSEWNKSFTEIK